MGDCMNEFNKKFINDIKKVHGDKNTPYLVINLNKVQDNYKEIKKAFDFADIYYAVKANPSDRVITLLDNMGSNFDCATIFELDKLLELNVDVNKVSYGNTIKKATSIEYAYKKGVRIFARDSENN